MRIYALSALLVMSASIAGFSQTPGFQSNSPIDFGGSAVGGTGTLNVERSVVVTNNGDAVLTISDIIQSSAEFAIPVSRFPPIPMSVSPGTSVSIPVSFDAMQAGARTGSMDIVDNAPGSPHTVQFTGTGITNDFAYSVTSSPSVTVTAGQPATFTVELVTGSQSSGSAELGATGLPPAATFSLPSTFPADMHVDMQNSEVLDFSAFISTTAAQTSAHNHLPSNWGYGIFAVLGIGLLAPCRFSRCRMFLFWGGLVLTAMTISCGGSSSPQMTPKAGTPPGTYSTSLTATIGTTTHSIPVTVIVK